MGIELTVATPQDQADLAAFVARAQATATDAVIRLAPRPDGLLGVWVQTGFEVLATRSVRADGPAAVVDAAAIAQALRPDVAAGVPVDVGFSMDSAWRGALPPGRGFTHLDDIPAATIVELAEAGAELARTQAGPLGPPPSLLAHPTITVDTADGSPPVEIPLRAVFALTAMGFVPVASASDDVVRVRVTATWIRLDARYGSAYVRRTKALGLTVS